MVRKNAAPQLRKFAELFGIPVVTTFMGKGAITAESECYVGTLGLGNDRQIPDLFARPTSSSLSGYDLVDTARADGTPTSTRRSSTSTSLPRKWTSTTCRRWRSSPISGKPSSSSRA